MRERFGGRRRRTIAALFAVALLAAACGDDGGGSAKNTGATGKSSGTSTGTGGGAATTTAAPETPVKGGTVTVALFSEIGNLDPVRATGSGGSDGNRFHALYGGLLTYDPVKTEAVGLQAESLKATNAGFTEFALKIKANQKFTDGTAFDAEAVKANWVRAQDPANKCSCLGVAASIASMTVADPLTLNFTLKVGNANFANGLARVSMNYIASKKAIDEKVDMTSKPQGAGPFTLDEWIRDNRMTMSRNPGWTASPGPYIDKLVYVVQSNEDQRIDGFKTGLFDGFYTAVPGSVATATKDVKESYYAQVAVNMGQAFLMNTAKAPFDDVRVRKAVIMAIPRDILAKDILSNSVPAQYFALKGSKEFSEATALPKYDLAGAQKLIDEYVKDKGGAPITFTMTAFQQTLDQARAKFIQSQFDQLKNIKAEIAVGDSPTNIGNVLAGNYQWSSWGFPTLDNDPGLFNAARSGLPTNYSKYSNAEVDKALDAARLTTDLTARGAAYKTVYEALARDLPWFPYTITTNGYMFKGNVRGGVMYEDGIPRVDLLWVKK